MNGLLNVLKPPGMTSHDVVEFVRRLTGAKVGHTGTLDPLAAGVLVLTVGNATRVTEFLTAGDKTYRAEFLLGMETDTLDLEGTVLRRQSTSHVTREAVLSAAQGLTGELEMKPPMYSAVKQGGRKLYELARAGKKVERVPRRVRVYRFDLLEFYAGESARCLCEIECSKGTYVRSLAQMLGQRLGCGACLSFLLRTVQAGHAITGSYTLDELSDLGPQGIAQALIPLAKGLHGMPTVEVTSHDRAALAQGRALLAPSGLIPGTWVLITVGGEAVCIAETVAGPGRAEPVQLQPRRVLSAPASRPLTKDGGP